MTIVTQIKMRPKNNIQEHNLIIVINNTLAPALAMMDIRRPCLCWSEYTTFSVKRVSTSRTREVTRPPPRTTSQLLGMWRDPATTHPRRKSSSTNNYPMKCSIHWYCLSMVSGVSMYSIDWTLCFLVTAHWSPYITADPLHLTCHYHLPLTQHIGLVNRDILRYTHLQYNKYILIHFSYSNFLGLYPSHLLPFNKYRNHECA